MKNEIYTFSAPAVRRAIQNKKDGNQIHVQAVNDNECYITNGNIVLLLSRFEYNRVIRPITGQEFSSYRIVNGHLSGEPMDIQKAFKGFHDGLRAAKDVIMQDSPVTICENGKALTGLYSSEKDFTVVVNKLYLDAFQDCTFFCAGPLQPVFAISPHIDIVGMILPVKDSRGNVSRAVRSYFVAPEEIPAQVSQATEEIRAALADSESARMAAEDAASAARCELNKARADLERAQARIAQLEAAAMQQPEPAERPATISKAEAAAAMFADLPGVTVTVKGAQTAAPVLWFSGNTEPHADSLRAKGAKWSAKKSAFYYCA